MHASLKELIRRKIAIKIAETKFKLFTLSRAVPSQMNFLQELNWDHLIILDACRYDFFEQEIYKYLKGKLSKALSPASFTYEWLKNVWKEFYNLTYFSANPIVNSKGITVHGFRAKDHYKQIIDVWDQGWSKELSTVPPWSVNRAVRRFKPAKSVIHYMQPHACMHGEISIDVLRQAYRDNLRTVFKYVTKLIPHLHGRVILTSDHGELLGEYGLLLHVGVRAVELRLVPWFEVG